MPDDDKNEQDPIVRGLPRLFRMMGIKFQEDLPKLKKQDNTELNNYSQTELRHLPGFNISNQERRNNPPGISELQTYLKTISETTGEWSDQIKAIQILTPEIKRSAEIMVASIMSPTDIQTTSINIVCQDTDLGENIESAVAELVTKFFNDELDFANRLYKYIQKALYEDGSAPVLILPQSNVKTLNRAADLDWFKSGRGGLLKHNVDELEAADRKVAQKHQVASTESLISTESITSIEPLIADKLRQSLESHNMFTKLNPSDIITQSKTAREEILKLFSENKQSVVITRDVSLLTKRQNDLDSAIARMTAEVEKSFMFDKLNPTYLINDAYDHEAHHSPAILELSSRAVIPIIIPGAPDKHIGYFILVDQWGMPIINTDRTSSHVTTFGPRRLTEAATQSAFGIPSLYRFSSQIDDNQRYELTSTIFGLTLKQLLDNKLEDYGLMGASIEESDAITTCIFRQILAQKRCTMVFVPEPMMVYFRFDHRDDGTGKSLTEGLSTLLALRTVLLMSYIMAATENSVNNKTITVAVDEKQTNVAQYLEMIRNAYVSKKMMRFDVNPLTVQQDLIQKSLTILPKGIKGISDSLDVQTEHRQTGAIAPDETLMEKLTDWVVTGLEVPHSALNQLSENEYARSVATTNMYFSNNIQTKQRVVNRYGTKFIQLYTKYSYPLRSRIAEIIKKSDKTNEVNSGEAIELKSNLKAEMNREESLTERVMTCIKHLKLILPPPRIVVDRSQFTELDQYLQSIDKIIETLYNDEMVSGEAQELQDTLRMLRSSIREKMAREYISNIGVQSIYDLPEANEIDMNPTMELIKFLTNQRKGISDWMKQVAQKSSSEDTGMMGGEAGGYGAGAGDMGGGAGGGDMGMDMGMGGSPAGGAEGGAAGGESADMSGGDTGAQSSNTPPAPDDFNTNMEPPKF